MRVAVHGLVRNRWRADPDESESCSSLRTREKAKVVSNASKEAFCGGAPLALRHVSRISSPTAMAVRLHDVKSITREFYALVAFCPDAQASSDRMSDFPSTASRRLDRIGVIRRLIANQPKVDRPANGARTRRAESRR